jgi:DNA-binding beta-propeller fold protein YncE
MLKTYLILNLVLAAIVTPACAASGHKQEGPYHILQTAKVGGDGGFDYVYADSAGRKLYVARTGQNSRIDVYSLDSLKQVGTIDKIRAHGAMVDPKSHKGFSSSKPMAVWDSKTLAPLKTIDVDGNPDGLLGDPSKEAIYILSHSEPNVTVIRAKDGSVGGTINIGGAPEQAAVDGKGTLFIDIEDTGEVAVVDTNTYKLVTKYPLGSKIGGNAGLALDVKNHVLFVACREPAVMVMLDSKTGKHLADLPIGTGCDGAAFNPKTHECFSSQGDGTLTIIKETSPTTFEVEQTLKTMPGAKTLALDSKTGKIYLIAAQYGAPPASGAQPANGRPRRGPMIPGSFSIIEVGK